MEHLVIDSNIIVSYLVESETLHQTTLSYINGLENGDYTFHSPMLVPVEVTAAISRRNPLPNRPAILARWQQTMTDWEQTGKVVLYPMGRSRMNGASRIAEQYHLTGADSLIAGLAEELDMPLKTNDMEILARSQRASV
jgi:predicted nucleic acid-binding protein